MKLLRLIVRKTKVCQFYKATGSCFTLTKFCRSTLSPKMRFKNLPTSLASLSFTTKLASVTPMDTRHCWERKQ